MRASILIVLSAVSLSTSAHARESLDQAAYTPEKAFIGHETSRDRFEIAGPHDPRYRNCDSLPGRCPPILKYPYEPMFVPGPKDLAIYAPNIRIRMITNHISHEVLTGTGVSIPVYSPGDRVEWYTECPSPKCIGYDSPEYTVYLPPVGEVYDEDLLVFEALYVSGTTKNDDYGVRCSDFGGNGPPSGGQLPLIQISYIYLDNTFYSDPLVDGAVSGPGVYPMGYSFDLSDSGGSSRIHVSGYVDVSCTADTAL